MSFYNTTSEQGATLTLSRRRANQQQDAVLNFFAERPRGLFAPHEVHAAVAAPTSPLTSIRRAITDLTTMGLLTKTSAKKVGPYGKSVHLWRLADEYAGAA